MTTANLSVGIDTAPAKAELLKLRALMQAQPYQLAFNFDARQIDNEIATFMRRKNFTVRLGAVNLGNISKQMADQFHNDAQRAVAKALSGHHVQFDHNLLTTQISAAVAKGFRQGVAASGVTLAGVGAAAGAAAPAAAQMVSHAVDPSLHAAIQRGILQTLSPAVEEMSRAALQIANAAKQSGVRSAVGRATAKEAISTKDPATGFTTSWSRKLDDPGESLARIQTERDALNLAKRKSELDKLNADGERQAQIVAQRRYDSEVARLRKAQSDGEKLNAEGERQAQVAAQKTYDREVNRLRKAQSAGEKLNAEGERQAQLVAQKRYDSEVARLRKVQSAGDKLNADGERQAQIAALKAYDREVNRLRKAQSVGDKLNAEGERQAQIVAQKRYDSEVGRLNKAQAAGDKLNVEGERQAQIAAQKTYDREVNRLRKNQLIGDKLNAEGERQAQIAAQRRYDSEVARLRKSQSAGDKLNAEGERAAQISAQKSFKKSADAAITAYFKQAEYEARKLYSGPGPLIAAAAKTSAKFGQAETSTHLGPSGQYLLSATGDLEQYRRKVGETSKAHAALASVMRDGHAAARGFAGSMGQMWLTWGNTAPLVAAAALGLSIRSVINTGKDLEYQLKSVSLLSDGSAVSVTTFADSIKGLMVPPVQAAQAMRGLAQNGLEVGQAMQALPTILRLATAGEMSLSEAALGATGVMEAFGLSVSELPRVADVFTKAAAISNTNVTEMVEAMKQASTVSDNYHVTLEETAATLAVFAQRNIRGTAAGTAMRNMISSLANPTKHAQQAMALLNLELYKGGQLKPYGEILSDLSQKLSVVNEKSKNAVLGAIFNERGFKGASTLLSDLREYETQLERLKKESKDFTKVFSEGLSETTQGKWKSLMAEFQTATSNAFYDGNSALKNFIDSLRSMVSSEGFRNFLHSLTSGVVGLTTTLIEHGKAIGTVLALWAGFGISKWLVLSIRGVAAALVGVEAAALGTATAVRVLGASAGVASLAVKGLIGSATLGVSYLITMAAEYVLLGRSTNEASDAQKAFNSNLALQNEAMARNTAAMEKDIERLKRRNALIRGGMTAKEAERVSSQPTEDTGVGMDLTKAREALAQAKAERAQAGPTKISWTSRSGAKPSEINRLDDAVKEAQKSVTNLEESFKQAQAKYKTDEETRVLNDEKDIRDSVNTFNWSIDRALKQNPKLKIANLKVDSDTLVKAGKDAATEMMDAAKSQLSAQLGDISVPTGDAERAARDERKSESRMLISQLNSETKEIEQYLKFRKQLDDAKYDPNLFGSTAVAAIAEQRQIQETTRLLKVEEDQLAKLKALQNRGDLPTSEKNDLQTEIERRTADYDLAKKQLAQDAELSKQRAANRDYGEEASFSAKVAKLNLDSDTELNKLRDAYAIQIVSPADAAANEAALKVNVRYAEVALGYQKELETLQASSVRIEVERSSILDGLAEYDADRLQSLDAAIQANGVSILQEQTKLSLLREQGKIAEAKAGGEARKLTDESQTAEYGFNKFWTDYVNSAESSAKTVEGIMKTSTDYMSTVFGNYVTGTKQSFKDLTISMLQDVTRMLANQMMQKFLMMAGNAILGGNPIAASGGSLGMAGWYPQAHGGVMTEYGALPLRKYAKGGIEHGPAVSIHGEGSLPEANVPLQDGRTIPVTLKGGVGGNTNVQINVVNNGSPVKAKSTQRETSQGVVIDLVLDAVASDMANGGRVHDATQRRFGLNPGGSTPRY